MLRMCCSAVENRTLEGEFALKQACAWPGLPCSDFRASPRGGRPVIQTMSLSPETAWNDCLDIIRDNVSRQSYKTWFAPLKAVGLSPEGETMRLTVQLPSRFYYEWLEEHYFGLLRKTVTKVLGPKGRLF